MFKTRDLLLFLLCAGFLLIAIGVTSVHQWFDGVTAFETLSEIEQEGPDFEAAEATPLDRAARILELQQKLAVRGNVITAAPELPVSTSDTTDNEAASEEADVAVAVGAVDTCVSYRAVALAWPTSGLVTEEREGRRLYVTAETVETPVTVGTSTTVQTAVTERIWLHLPIRTSAYPTPACVPYDVVGIALDGSLIRNNEQGIYSVFGAETLIGYALDGLPIYGQNSTVATDACGGVVVNGQYRYYLSSERDGVLGCFAAAPVQL